MIAKNKFCHEWHKNTKIITMEKRNTLSGYEITTFFQASLLKFQPLSQPFH